MCGRFVIFIFLGLITSCSGDDSSVSQAPLPDSTTKICTSGDTIACDQLAGIWSGGNASCNSSGTAYDVNLCERAGDQNRRIRETVYPAQRDSRWENAICNYQGDFVFQISYPPPSTKPKTWVIFLKGGGFCGFNTPGQNDCSHRALHHLAPMQDDDVTPFPADKTVGYDPTVEDPDFGNAIQVEAHYCSSDLWSGSNLNSFPVQWMNDTFSQSWKFTGHLNVEAMISILAERYGLDDNDPNLAIHFSGNSAGGFGVMNNAEWMKSKFPKTSDRGNLMLSLSAGFIPLTWDDPNFITFDRPETATAMEAFKHLTEIWKSVLHSSCVADHASEPHVCISGDYLYEYIIGSDTSKGQLDLPLLIFQNNQDQIYMDLLQISTVTDPLPPLQQEARQDFMDQLNVALGINPLVPNTSSRIKWLYAVSDPVKTDQNGNDEPLVHGPSDYEFDSPDGVTNSWSEVTRRFWNTRGQGPGRGEIPGEVHTYDCNWVPSHVCR